MEEFFEIPEPREESEHEPDPPAWAGPPTDVVAALVPDRRLLVRTDRLAILLTHIDAFPTGASMRIRIMARWAPGMTREDWAHLEETVFDRRRTRRPSEFAEEFLRIGVQFADGRKATNLDHPFGHHPDGGEPAPPSLVEHGRGGSDRDRFITQGRNLWLWPLPPPEPFDLVIEWPVFRIPITRTSIDGALIVAAAQQTEGAWLEA